MTSLSHYEAKIFQRHEEQCKFLHNPNTVISYSLWSWCFISEKELIHFLTAPQGTVTQHIFNLLSKLCCYHRFHPEISSLPSGVHMSDCRAQLYICVTKTANNKLAKKSSSLLTKWSYFGKIFHILADIKEIHRNTWIGLCIPKWQVSLASWSY